MHVYVFFASLQLSIPLITTFYLIVFHVSALKWFRSYLSSRCFRFKYNFSSLILCICGVPYSSVLLLRLFVTFSVLSFLSLNHHLYAEITRLFFSIITHYIISLSGLLPVSRVSTLNSCEAEFLQTTICQSTQLYLCNLISQLLTSICITYLWDQFPPSDRFLSAFISFSKWHFTIFILTIFIVHKNFITSPLFQPRLFHISFSSHTSCLQNLGTIFRNSCTY